MSGGAIAQISPRMRLALFLRDIDHAPTLTQVRGAISMFGEYEDAEMGLTDSQGYALCIALEELERNMVLMGRISANVWASAHDAGLVSPQCWAVGA